MKRWNLPHLLLLAALPLVAWVARGAGWSPPLVLAAGTLAMLAWLMAAERWWPHRADWRPAPADLRRDGIFLGVNAIVDAGASVLLHGAAIALAAAGLGSGWAAGLPAWVQWPLAVALGELGPYALHRWAHRGGWGWRVHGVHHRPEALHASNNLTTHPFNVLWNRLARTLPWLLLGFDAQVLLAVALFLQAQSYATHANVRGTLGPLAWLIGSAEAHRWHHSTVLAEARNFSTALPLWDQLFGTWYLPPRSGPVRVGISDAGWPAPADWRRLLLSPVCRRCAACLVFSSRVPSGCSRQRPGGGRGHR